MYRSIVWCGISRKNAFSIHLNKNIHKLDHQGIRPPQQITLLRSKVVEAHSHRIVGSNEWIESVSHVPMQFGHLNLWTNLNFLNCLFLKSLNILLSAFGPMKQYKTYFPLEKSELTDSMECPPLDENSELKLWFNVGLSWWIYIQVIIQMLLAQSKG